MAKKPLSPKEKEKRQKILAAVLGVVLLAVAAFQGPKLWKQLHPKAPSQPTVIPTASAPPPGSPLPTSLGGGGVAQPAAATTPTSGVPAASAGQLVQFGRFTSKNPFVQQVQPCSDSCPGSGSSSGSGAAASGTKAPAKKPPAPTTTSSAPSAPPTPTTTTAPAKPTQAVISVNGAKQVVSVGGQFPTSSPTFVLVSLDRRSAKIGIVGGSYSDGSQTLTLKLGKELTLMNTADGTRYALILVSTG